MKGNKPIPYDAVFSKTSVLIYFREIEIGEAKKRTRAIAYKVPTPLLEGTSILPANEEIDPEDKLP